MADTNSKPEKRTLSFGGILLIMIGLFALLDQFITIEITGGIFLGGLGLFFILWGASQHQAGLLIPSGILTGLSVGVFLLEDSSLAITEAYEAGIFLFSLALGFALITLLTRLFSGAAHWWALIVSGILALIAGGVIVLEQPEDGALRQTVEAIFNASAYIWPVALVLLGLWLIFRRRGA
jgi:uncharacterized membrane protein HdeD (DUF308 family)